MLSLDRITCKRGHQVLFSDLSITFGDRCLAVIRGGNGSGKTTLLKTISGLTPPYEGQILYANTPVTGQHYAEYCSLIHYIGHEHALKPELTVEENLLFWAKLKGSPSRISAAIHFWELGAVQDTLFSQLSAGWKKKVSLARLLVSNAEIWLLDEPLVNLDDEAKMRFAGMVDARLEQGGTVLLTSHEDNLPLKHYQIIQLEDWCV